MYVGFTFISVGLILALYSATTQFIMVVVVVVVVVVDVVLVVVVVVINVVVAWFCGVVVDVVGVVGGGVP